MFCVANIVSIRQRETRTGKFIGHLRNWQFFSFSPFLLVFIIGKCCSNGFPFASSVITLPSDIHFVCVVSLADK